MEEELRSNQFADNFHWFIQISIQQVTSQK